MTVDVSRGAWQLVLQGEEVPRTSMFLGSALKKDAFNALFAAFFAAFFAGSSSFSSISKSQLNSMAAVSGSCRRFCVRWVNADSRRAADGFRIRLAADLEGPGSEFAVRFAEVGQVTRGGPGGRRGGSMGRVTVRVLGRTDGRGCWMRSWLLGDVFGAAVAEDWECNVPRTSIHKKC